MGTVIEIILALASLSGLLGVFLSHVQWKEKFKIQKVEFEQTREVLERDIKDVKKGMIDYKDAINKLTGSLYKILYGVKADRCYIVQPLPIDNTKYLVIKFEVDDRGVTECMKFFENFDVTKYYSLYTNLKSSEFLYYRHTDDISDVKARHIVVANGTNTLAAHRILDNGDRYLGSIICEWKNFDDNDVTVHEVQEFMEDGANDVQFFLPPVEE